MSLLRRIYLSTQFWFKKYLYCLSSLDGIPMTLSTLEPIVVRFMPERLITKGNFDNVSPEKKKPEMGISGLSNQTDSTHESKLNGNEFTLSLAEAPNLYKQTGTSMSDDGFLKLQRSIHNDSRWITLPPVYRAIFIEILFLAVYKPTQYNVHGNIINLEPGQYCTTQRDLIHQMGGPKFFPKTTLIRALKKLQEFQWIKTQKVSGPSKKSCSDRVQNVHPNADQNKKSHPRQEKTLITVLLRDTYLSKENETDTPKQDDTGPNRGPKADQKRTINEERKEREDIRETIDRADAPVRSLLSDLEKEEQKQPSVFDAPKPKVSKDPMTPEQQKYYDSVWPWLVQMNMADGYTVKNSNGKTPKGIKSSDLVTWVKTYPFQSITMILKQVQKEAVDLTYPGYIVKLFKANVPAKKDNLEINDAYAKKAIQDYKCNHLEDLKQYVRDLHNGNDFQKTLPPEVFKGMLDKSIEMAQMRESEERSEEEYY